jgi:hypothetical protein
LAGGALQGWWSHCAGYSFGMTSTDPNDEPRPDHQGLTIGVDALDDGSAAVHVVWTSTSPWVPGGSMTLSTNDPRVFNLGYKGTVEGLIIQLRPTLQAMLSEVWPPL